MRLTRTHWVLLIVAALFSGMGMAEEASVKIFSPVEGAILNAKVDNVVSYEIVPGPKGDHAHLYLDGKEIAILRKLKGSYTFVYQTGDQESYNQDTLTPGERNICVKVVNKNHTPIGVEKCVKVMVK